MSADLNFGDLGTTPAPDIQASQIEAERAKLQARIESLEADLALIQRGKEAAERALRYERERALELAQNGMYSLKRDWVALVNELQIIKGQTIGEDPKENSEYQEALVIDFCNRLRIGALADLESLDDETLYVKAKAYEVWYRACSAVLANRTIKLKIDKTSEFEETKKRIREKEKEVKRAKEVEKLEKRRQTPEEKMISTLMGFGMSEADARQHVAKAQSAAKEMMDQTKN